MELWLDVGVWSRVFFCTGGSTAGAAGDLFLWLGGALVVALVGCVGALPPVLVLAS